MVLIHVVAHSLDSIGVSMCMCMCELSGDKWDLGLQFLEDMVERGIEPSRRMYTLVIEACERGGQKGLAEKLQVRSDSHHERRVKQAQERQRGYSWGGGEISSL